MRRLVLVLLGLACLAPARGSSFDIEKEKAREKVVQMQLLSAAGAPPVLRTIMGSPLTVFIGDDMSFQILNSIVPGAGQVYPGSCTASTADLGIFARIGTTLFAPDFADHPCGSASGGIGANTPWTPVSISAVTGTGTAADPFTVVVVGDAGTSGLRLTMTVTYVNAENFFRESLAFTSTGGPITFDVFTGADLFLAGSDAGVPFYISTSGSVGGQDCGTPPTYTILMIPVSPADSYSGNGYSTIWSQIGAGSLPNTLASGCLDNGSALQWRSRTVSPGAATTIQTATSFGAIPPIAAGPPSTVPTLSLPMLALFGVLLAGIAFVLMRRH